MSEIPKAGGDNVDQFNQTEREDSHRVVRSLAEQFSYSSVEFRSESEGSALLLVGDREGAVIAHSGALISAAPGASFSGSVRVREDCTFVGCRFDGQVIIEDSSVTVLFIACVFRHNQGPMVVLASGARANFSGCRFGPRAFASGVVIENPGAAALANVSCCSNKTGLSMGTHTAFGLTT